MQALAERLGAAVGGSELTALHPLQFSALKNVADTSALIGRTVEGIGRRGKYLVWSVRPSGGEREGADRTRLLIHLSQGGRIDVETPPKATKPKGALLRLTFANDTAVLLKEFGTERKAGWWVLGPGDDGPLTVLGPEPGSDEFRDLLLTGQDRRRVHTILRDQRTVSGIGRGYTDDALHRACLSPYASLASLTPEERQRLLDAIDEVMAAGLEAERRRTGGLPPKVGDHWVVHKRWGTPCPVCGEELQRVSYESYEVTYCPHCQTGGKVLADRRLSRLLK